jgi:hypothetical protein
MDTKLSRGEESASKIRGCSVIYKALPFRSPPGVCYISPTLFNAHVDDLEDCIPNYLDINTHKYADRGRGSISKVEGH